MNNSCHGLPKTAECVVFWPEKQWRTVAPSVHGRCMYSYTPLKHTKDQQLGRCISPVGFFTSKAWRTAFHMYFAKHLTFLPENVRGISNGIQLPIDCSNCSCLGNSGSQVLQIFLLNVQACAIAPSMSSEAQCPCRPAQVVQALAFVPLQHVFANPRAQPGE